MRGVSGNFRTGFRDRATPSFLGAGSEHLFTMWKSKSQCGKRDKALALVSRPQSRCNGGIAIDCQRKDTDMPIYEYRCRDCDATFEQLVRGGEQPECPDCHGQSLAKLLSTFAVGGHAPPPCGTAPACRTCGGNPGSCEL